MGITCCSDKPTLESEPEEKSKFILGLTTILVKKTLNKREEFEDLGSAERALRELEKMLVAALGKVEESEAESTGTSPSCVSLVESMKSKMREYKSIARRPEKDSESQEIAAEQILYFKQKKEELRTILKELTSALRELSDFKTKSQLLQVVEPKVKSVKGLAIGLTKRIDFWKVSPNITQLEGFGSLEQEIGRITSKVLDCEAAVKRLVEAQYMSPLKGKIERYIEKLKWYEGLANRELVAEKPIEKPTISEVSIDQESDEFTRGAEHWPEEEDDDEPPGAKEKEKKSPDKDKEKKPIIPQSKPKEESGLKSTPPKKGADEVSPGSKTPKPSVLMKPHPTLQSPSHAAPPGAFTLKSMMTKARGETPKAAIPFFATKLQAPPQVSAVKIIAEVQKEEGKARVQIEEEKETLGPKLSPEQLNLATTLISDVPGLEIEGLYSQNSEYNTLQSRSFLRKIFNLHHSNYPQPANQETVLALFQQILSKKAIEDMYDLSSGKAPLSLDYSVVKFFYEEFGGDALSRLIGFLHGLTLLLQSGQPQPRLIAKVLNVFVVNPLPNAIVSAIPKVVSDLQEFIQTDRPEVLGGTLPLVRALDLVHQMFREQKLQGVEMVKRIKPEGMTMNEYMVFLLCYRMKSLQKESLFKFVSDGAEKLPLQNLKPRLCEALEPWVSDADLDTAVTSFDLTNTGSMNRVLFNKVFDLRRFRDQVKETYVPVYTFLSQFITICLQQRQTAILELGQVFHPVGNRATRVEFTQFLQSIDSSLDFETLVPVHPEGEGYGFADLLEVTEKWLIGHYENMYFGNVYAVSRSWLGKREPEPPSCVVELSAGL